MDQREQIADKNEAMLTMLDGRQSSIWTAMPGIIQSYDPSKGTCVVKIALLGNVLQKDGTYKTVEIKPLQDCPVVFPCGGGYVLTFPLKQGDECLVILASRCIDAWWQSGGVQKQQEFRMHDLSDGFVLPGPRSVPNVPPNVSTNSVQLRNVSGDEFIELMGGEAKMSVPVTETTGNLKVGTGASGTFTTPTGQTVTVMDGIITNIF